jgi:hypothetical protein
MINCPNNYFLVSSDIFLKLSVIVNQTFLLVLPKDLSFMFPICYQLESTLFWRSNLINYLL